MKTPLYAVVEFKTGKFTRYGESFDIGYVTKSILNKKPNQRVRILVNHNSKFIMRKNIVAIVPLVG